MGKMTDPALVIRADAGPAIGTGHVMRCLALAAGFRTATSGAARVRFISSEELPPSLKTRLADERCESSVVEAPRASDADVTARAAKDLGAEWVVVDGYGFDGAFEEAIGRSGLRVVALDDFVHTRHVSELVVNQNLHAARGAYEPVRAGTRLLLGPGFALIRREFWRYREVNRTYASRARKVLVTLGGADPGNVTPSVLRGLAPLGLEVRAVVGGADTMREQTLAVARDLGIEALVASRNMGEHMAWADLAVASAGVTLLEMLCAGTPSLLVISAENQRPGARAAEERGLARSLGWYEDVTPAKVTALASELIDDSDARRRIGELGRETVDGFGAERVGREMMGQDCREFRLRAVESNDMKLLWSWANDPGTRATSFNPAPIPWEDHVAWFSKKLNEPSSVMYIAEFPGKRPVGIVRFEVSGPAAELSITVAPEERGRGLAARMLDRAVVRLFRSSAVQTVTALVKPENARSLKAFDRASFIRTESPRADAVQFVRHRLEPSAA